jgi:hypothetical protein
MSVAALLAAASSKISGAARILLDVANRTGDEHETRRKTSFLIRELTSCKSLINSAAPEKEREMEI